MDGQGGKSTYTLAFLTSQQLALANAVVQLRLALVVQVAVAAVVVGKQELAHASAMTVAAVAVAVKLAAVARQQSKRSNQEDLILAIMLDVLCPSTKGA